MQTLSQLLAGELKGAKRIKLSCGLTTFPPQLFELADTLEILDLSNNQLSALPSDFDTFQKLKILFLSENPFEIFPEVLGKCLNLSMIGFKSCKIREIPPNSFPKNLRWLILTNNQIAHLPAEIGDCWRMEKLMLAGNRLTSLPQEMAKCTNLALLRISANEIETLPEWLLRMPNLAWLAFAGNKLPNSQAEQSDFSQIEWKELQIEKQLGEGASGQIFKAVWLPKQKEIAVKIFKGEVTSDGFPKDEMAVTKLVGRHQNLVPLLGEVQGHEKMALAFELIPTSFINLGITPSFDSCSRDVFPPDFSLTEAEVTRIAEDVAKACLHLHEKGIMNGDLYAHNILIDRENHKTLLSDFGAAKKYDIQAEQAVLLQKIEVKAFGFLLDDLINLCEVSANLVFLRELREECLAKNVAQRPLFAKIVRRFSLHN